MHKTGNKIAATVVAGLFLGVATQVVAYEGSEVKDGGTITGTIKFAGSRPVRKKLRVTKDRDVCEKKQHLSWDLVVGPRKGVTNAVVRLIDVKKGKKWASTKATLDQKSCEYTPHVVVVPAGGTLNILNSDGILHNIHTYGKVNATINRAQPKFKKVLPVRFKKPEIVKVTCDAHSWMLGWLVVSNHPYVAVTNDKGEFMLSDVPPGNYQLEVWHETLGTKVQDVTVKAKGEVKFSIVLAKP